MAQLILVVVDDTCWVPTNVSGSFHWKTLPSLSECFHICRERADCAGIQEDSNGTCRAIVIDDEQNYFAGQMLVRLDNCPEDETDLHLTAKGAWYMQGSYSQSNVFRQQVSYTHAGATPDLQFHFVLREFAHMKLPKACENASWLLVHTNASDFKKGSMEAPEYCGNAVACTGSDVVPNAFENGYEEFELEFLPAELKDAAVLQKPEALQQAELKPLASSCSLTATSSVVFGTLEETEHFSLHPCECFGEAHAQASTVLKVPHSTTFARSKTYTC